MIDIGKMRYFSTSVTVQDKNRKFLEKPLVDINSTVSIPLFSYKESTERAKTVDVIWFNERNMSVTGRFL